MPVDINWAAVILATVVNMALGAAWYSPLLFAKPWTAGVEKSIGKEGFERIKQNMRGPTAARTYGLTAVGAFLLAYVMGLFVDYKGADSIAEGAMIGAVAWLGFVAATSLNTVLFEGRSRRVYVITSTQFLVAFVVSGAILGLWQ